MNYYANSILICFVCNLISLDIILNVLQFFFKNKSFVKCMLPIYIIYDENGIKLKYLYYKIDANYCKMNGKKNDIQNYLFFS